VTRMGEGTRVLVRRDDVARHIGIAIEEFMEEK